MKKLKNKEITDIKKLDTDMKVLEIIQCSIAGILVTVYIAAIVYIICWASADIKNTKEKEIEKRTEVEALMKNDDYVYFYNSIEIDSETAKDLLLNSKCSFFKEKGTMNIHIEKDE